MQKKPTQPDSEKLKRLIVSSFFLSAPIKAFYIDVADSLDAKFRNKLIEVFSNFKEKQIEALKSLCQSDDEKAKQLFCLLKELKKKLISAKSKVKISNLNN